MWPSVLEGAICLNFLERIKNMSKIQKAVSEITVLYKGEKVYSRTIRLSSVYGYLEDGEDEKGENEDKDGSLSW